MAAIKIKNRRKKKIIIIKKTRTNKRWTVEVKKNQVEGVIED